MTFSDRSATVYALTLSAAMFARWGDMAVAWVIFPLLCGVWAWHFTIWVPGYWRHRPRRRP